MKTLEKIIKSVKNFGKAALLTGALAASSCIETEPIGVEPIPPQDPPAITIDGLAYSPFRDYQSPMQQIFPSVSEVDQDLSIISYATSRIRMYGDDDVLFEVPRLCSEKNIECYAAAWLDNYTESNTLSINNLIQIANQNHSTTKGLIVGNESILWGYMSQAQLINHINTVKSSTDVPVTTAENWDVWLSNPNLAQAVDFIFIHVHPYWAGIHVNDAAQYVVNKYNQVKNAYPTKEVIIGETGWPTDGSTRGLAVPSEANQATFLNNFIPLAESNNVRYFIFEAFDEKWKAQFGDVEDNWGLWYSDRTQKPSLDSLGVVSPSPVDDTDDSEGCMPGKGNYAGLVLLSAIPLAMLKKRYQNEKA